MLLWVMGVRFENTLTDSGKRNVTSVVSRHYEWVFKILRLPLLLFELQVPNLGDSLAAGS